MSVIARQVNEPSFKQIASTTKGLGVLAMISSTIKNWDDVIQFQAIRCAAKGANRRGPFLPLSWGKLFPVSAKFRGFMENVVFAPWNNLKHFVTVQSPQLAGRFGNSFSCFLGMFVTKGVFVSNTLSLSALRNFPFCFFGMSSAPKGILLSDVVPTNTGVGTKTGLAISDSPGLTKEFPTANDAIKVFPGFVLIHQMPPSDNGVKSRNNSILCYCLNVVNSKVESILSQAQKEIFGKVQRLWDEAKAIGYAGNFPHERPTRKG